MGELNHQDRHTIEEIAPEALIGKSRESILSAIITRFFHDLEHSSLVSILNHLKTTHALDGHQIQYLQEGEMRTGRVRGIGPQGGLLIEGDDDQELFHVSELRLLDKG